MYPTQHPNAVITPGTTYQGGFSPSGIRTPQFHLQNPNPYVQTDPNFYPKYQNVGTDPDQPIIENVNKKLVYDQEQQTSVQKQNINEESKLVDQNDDMLDIEMKDVSEKYAMKDHIERVRMQNRVINQLKSQQINKTPAKDPAQNSFAASPSDLAHNKDNSSVFLLDPVTRGWLDALAYVENDDFQSAYETVLSMGDDIYLLRLISHTGPVTRYLHPKTSAEVVKKLNKIVRCNILQAFTTDWIEDSHKYGHFKEFKQDQKNEYLDTLDLFSEDRNDQDLADKSARLYKSIIDDEMQVYEEDE